ncbi:MAG: hypothetical protein WCQ95_12210 [Bacteroidota bacterium]
MKSYKILLALFSLTVLFSCGPNKKEEEKQKRKEDSLMEIERNRALDNANKLLSQDTVVAAADSITKQKK